MKTVRGHLDGPSLSLNKYPQVLIPQTLCKAWLSVESEALGTQNNMMLNNSLW